MTAIGAVGIELWSMSSDIYFDNVLITDDIDVANAWAAETFELKVSQFNLCASYEHEMSKRHVGDWQ